jgi:ABC-type transporter MlaC component
MSCQRVVCFRFKTEVTPEQRQEMVAAFRTLARQIPAFATYRDGATLQG